MVKLPVAEPAGVETAESTKYDVQETECPLPADLGTKTAIRIAQFADGLYRFGMWLSAEWTPKKVDRFPMPDHAGFPTYEAAFEACLAECIALWGKIPSDPRIDRTIAFLRGDELPQAAAETPAAEAPAAPAAAEEPPASTALEEPSVAAADFEQVLCEELQLRPSIANRFYVAVHLGKRGSAWHWQPRLRFRRLPDDNASHVLHDLTKDSPSAPSLEAAELLAGDALLDLVKPMDMRLAADVAAWTETVRDRKRHVSPPEQAPTAPPPAEPTAGQVAEQPGESTTPTTAEAVETVETTAVEPEPAAATSESVVEPAAESTAEQPHEPPAPETVEQPAEQVAEEIAEETGDEDEAEETDYAAAIREAQAEVASLSVEVAELTERRKVVKDRLKEATEELRALERHAPGSEAKATPSETANEAAKSTTRTAKLSLGGADVEVQVTEPVAITPENWPSLPFGELAKHGLKQGIIEICGENPKMPIRTLGDWSEWCKKFLPTEVARIGPSKADMIADAFEKFWKANPQLTR